MSIQQYLDNMKNNVIMNNSSCIPKISENKGFGLFASGNISNDTIVFSEEPIVAGQYSWGVVYGFLACHHCLKSLETAGEMVKRLANDQSLTLPLADDKCTINVSEFRLCPDCQATFCSENCLATAIQQYHRHVCTKGEQDHPLQKVDEMWRNMHFPPETTSLLMIVKIIGIVISAGTIPSIFQYFYQSIENKGHIHKLLKVEFISHLDLLRDALLQIYGSNALVQQLMERDNFITLIALIGMNGQGIGTSSFADYCNRLDNLEMSLDDRTKLDMMLDEIYEKVDAHSGVFVDVEGTGLYELQSKLNHSCQPNVQIVFEQSNHRLSVKALRDINDGEELFISYLSPCDLQSSRHTRRKFLLENYLFECECTKCTEQINDPDVTSDEESDME